MTGSGVHKRVLGWKYSFEAINIKMSQFFSWLWSCLNEDPKQKGSEKKKAADKEDCYATDEKWQTKLIWFQASNAVVPAKSFLKQKKKRKKIRVEKVPERCYWPGKIQVHC